MGGYKSNVQFKSGNQGRCAGRNHHEYAQERFYYGTDRDSRRKECRRNKGYHRKARAGSGIIPNTEQLKQEAADHGNVVCCFFAFLFHVVEKMRNPCVKDMYKLIKEFINVLFKQYRRKTCGMQGYKTKKGGTTLC